MPDKDISTGESDCLNAIDHFTQLSQDCFNIIGQYLDGWTVVNLALINKDANFKLNNEESKEIWSTLFQLKKLKLLPPALKKNQTSVQKKLEFTE